MKRGLNMRKYKFICPVCNHDTLMVKYEAKYVYSYLLDSDAPGLINTEELLPFMYDMRDQTESKQYIECTECGALFPCIFTEADKGINFSALKKAIDQNNREKWCR